MVRPLVVQQSFPTPRPTTNPYITMLANSLDGVPDLRVRTFTWPRALVGRFDVFHTHWPENLVTGRTAPTAAIRQALFLLLLLRLRMTRTPLVRTAHNVQLPRDLTRRQSWLLRLAERRTTLRIVLNPFTPLPPHAPRELIPHGHYRDWFAGRSRRRAEAGRVLFFGLVRGYKGVDTLVTAFRDALPGDEAATLRVAGRATSDAMAQRLRELAAADRRVSLRLAHLSDDELVDEVGRAELVVLPYPDMHNSGSVLAALSLDRPVLVPDNEVNRWLATEVGPGWVHTFAGTIAGSDIDAAVAAVRRRGEQGGSPDLDGRGWSGTGAAHLRAYRRAIRCARGEEAR